MVFERFCFWYASCLEICNAVDASPSNPDLRLIPSIALTASKSRPALVEATALTTATKLDAGHVAKDTVRAVCRAVSVPVVAIGGITKENISELAGCGIDGVALVSAIFAAEDIESECRRLKQLSEKMISE